MTAVALLTNYTWAILLGSAGTLYLIYSWSQRGRYKNMPPFPVKPLPIVGNLLAMEKNPRKQILKWRDEVGDIFTLDLAGKLVVFVHGFERIKEIYVKNGNRCSDRPVLFHDTATDTVNLGIGTSSGPLWKEERATAYTILKSFGMVNGKRDENMEHEMVCFMEELEKLNGKPANIHYIVMKAVSNTVISLLFGKRFDYEDETFKNILKITAIVEMTGTTQILQFYPKLAILPGDLFQGKELKEKITTSFKWVKDTFVQDKDKITNYSDFDHNKTTATKDYIIAYFREKLRKEKAGSKTHLCTKSLVKSVSDLITAGTESTTTNILWFTLYMINYPEAQQKAFREIEKHVGTDRPPNMDDKPNLTYVNALIMETQRLASITPFPIMHRCSNDVEIAGYTIPKGTDVSINLDSVLHDKSIWGQDVHVFRPERFIDQDGKLIQREEFIPYSIGRRQCLAEAYAKTQLFMFFTSMLQRFQFRPEVPGVMPPMKEVFGLAAPPVPFKVKCVDRRTI